MLFPESSKASGHSKDVALIYFFFLYMSIENIDMDNFSEFFPRNKNVYRKSDEW
jgi:hypothetical protein